MRVLRRGHAPEEAGGDKRRRVPGGSQPGIRVIRMARALPRSPCGLGVPTSPNPLPLAAVPSLRRRLKPEAKSVFPKNPWLGGQRSLGGWPGLGGSEERWQASVPLASGAGMAHTAPQLGLSAGLPSGLSLTRHSLDLKLARDLQLGMEAREPQRPSMEGVGSFPGERGWVRHVWGVWAQAVKGEPSGHPSPPGDASFLQHLPFPLHLDKHLPVPCTVLGTLYCNRQFMSLSPPEVHPLFVHLLNTW